jgi:hypothetical protein
MSDENIKVALLVHSCDRYEILYKGFYYFFSQYWNERIPCKCYLSTETTDASIPGFENIKSGKGEWADRFSFLLREKIKEDYILFFQEDMWLTKKVNSTFFKELFKMAAEKKWKMVKLHSSDIYKTIPIPDYIEGFNVTKVDIAKSSFLFSHQVTLFEKKFLLSQLFKNEQPWQNEQNASERLKILAPEIIHIDYFAQNGNAPINKNINPIGRSEYQGVSYNSTLHHNVRPFIDELMKGNKEQKQYARKLRHHYLFNLTHDGKARPIKEKMFMNFKIWAKGLKPRIRYALLNLFK